MEKPRVLILTKDLDAAKTVEEQFPAECCFVSLRLWEKSQYPTDADYDLICLHKSEITDGLKEVFAVKKKYIMTPVVLIASMNVEVAVNAMKGGMFYAMRPPVTKDHVQKLIHNLPQATANGTVEDFVGESNSARQVRLIADKASSIDSPLLITGETGTGKEVIARWVHQHSQRAKGPFMAMNCSAIPMSLAESELFGYERGAFTGSIGAYMGMIESAQGGTLFLDEIGDMDLAIQAKTLRVLEEKIVRRIGLREDIPVNFRFIAATNKKLFEEINKGCFRQDLYYRLKCLEIAIPPLRQRREDIPAIVYALLKRMGNPPIPIVNDALRVLQDYDWPGNVRELKYVLEGACAFVGENGVIQFDHLYEAGLPRRNGNVGVSIPLNLPHPFNSLSLPEPEIRMEASVNNTSAPIIQGAESAQPAPDECEATNSGIQAAGQPPQNSQEFKEKLSAKAPQPPPAATSSAPAQAVQTSFPGALETKADGAADSLVEWQKNTHQTNGASANAKVAPLSQATDQSSPNMSPKPTAQENGGDAASPAPENLDQFDRACSKIDTWRDEGATTESRALFVKQLYEVCPGFWVAAALFLARYEIILSAVKHIGSKTDTEIASQITRQTIADMLKPGYFATELRKIATTAKLNNEAKTAKDKTEWQDAKVRGLALAEIGDKVRVNQIRSNAPKESQNAFNRGLPNAIHSMRQVDSELSQAKLGARVAQLRIALRKAIKCLKPAKRKVFEQAINKVCTPHKGKNIKLPDIERFLTKNIEK